jgi:hypothetical protein
MNWHRKVRLKVIKVYKVIYSLFLPTDKSIEQDLHFFGLENFQLPKTIEIADNDYSRYTSEIRLSEVKVNVNKLQNHNKKLTEDIQRSQKSIKALKEYVTI